MLVDDVASEGKPERLDPLGHHGQRLPGRSLQSSYDDYLHARGITAPLSRPDNDADARAQPADLYWHNGRDPDPRVSVEIAVEEIALSGLSIELQKDWRLG
jgi:hypothetical protein